MRSPKRTTARGPIQACGVGLRAALEPRVGIEVPLLAGSIRRGRPWLPQLGRQLPAPGRGRFDYVLSIIVVSVIDIPLSLFMLSQATSRRASRPGTEKRAPGTWDCMP